MDYTSSVRWLTELGLDDPDFIHHCQLSSLDQATSDHIAQALDSCKEVNNNHHHQYQSQQQQQQQQQPIRHYQQHHVNNNNHSNSNSNSHHSAESYSNSSYAATIDVLPQPPKAVHQQLDAPTSRPAKALKTSSGSWKSSPVYPYSPEAQVPAVVPEASSPTPRILSFGGSCNVYPAAPVAATATGSGGRHNQTQAFGPFGRALVKPKEDFSGFSISQGSTVTAFSAGVSNNNNGSKRSASAMIGGGAGSKPPSTSQDHIIAERKRREKLSQRFIALSAIVPGLKKMDKATVLADAIKYVKTLQERVKDLEDITAKRTVESVVLVKKTQLVPADEDTSSSDENSDGGSGATNSHGGGNAAEASSLPEIEAKVTEKTVLLRVHCHKRKGVLVKLLAEIERLHLSVANTSVMPFPGSVLDITIIAQMDDDFSMSVKDLVRALNSSIISSCSSI